MRRSVLSIFLTGRYLSSVAFIFTLLISSTSLAQIQSVPGFIVTLNHDTVSGFIEIRSKQSHYASCNFHKTKKDRAKQYNPSEITAYGLTGVSYYEVIIIKGEMGGEKRVFGNIILDGKSSLLRYKSDFFLRHDSLGVLSLHYNGAQDFKGKNNVKGILNFVFSDCKSKPVRWDSLILSDAKIYELVKNYNSCKHSKTMDYQRRIKLFSFHLGVTAGTNTSSISQAFTTSNYLDQVFTTVKFKSNNSPIYGLNGYLGFPWFSNNFSLYAEISWFKSSISGHASGLGYYGAETEDVALSMNYLKKAFGIRVQFPARLVTPYIKAGWSTYSASNFSNSRVHTFTINGIAFQVASTPWYDASQFGLWLGAGVQKRINKRIAYNLEARIDRTTGLNGDYSLNSLYSTFLVGLVF